MSRLALLPLILLLSALAPLYQWREPRYRRLCGWLDPAMGVHWDRLYRERTGHAARNIMAEWVRLDPQRAGKVLSLLLMVSIVINLTQALYG